MKGLQACYKWKEGYCVGSVRRGHPLDWQQRTEHCWTANRGQATALERSSLGRLRLSLLDDPGGGGGIAVNSGKIGVKIEIHLFLVATLYASHEQQ